MGLIIQFELLLLLFFFLAPLQLLTDQIFYFPSKILNSGEPLDTFQMYVIKKVTAGCNFNVLFGRRVKSVVEEVELMTVLILHQVYSESRSLC